MAFLRFRACGHQQFVGPPRSGYVTPREGYCRRCAAQMRYANPKIVVTVKRRLFVAVRVSLAHELAMRELRGR